MVVKKFYGNNTREALRQVREALGPDALILSNRQVAGGIEIMAVADTDVALLTSGNGAGTTAPRTPVEPPAAQRLANTYSLLDENGNDLPRVARQRGRAPAQSTDDPPFLISANRERRQEPVSPTRQYVAPEVREEIAAPRPPPAHPEPPEPAPRMAPAAAPSNGNAATEPELSGLSEDILREVRTLRGLLESQLAGFAWGDISRHHPERLDVLRQLLAAGFSPRLSRELLEHLPTDLQGDGALQWARQALLRNLRVEEPEQDLIGAGGVFALVGPTGVGKTTTVAKLAARYTLKFGADRVALISTDTYRIGAHDQLRIYGKILNVPVYSVKDEDDLQLTLGDLSTRHLVLIDTVGMSQRDRRLTEQIALLAGHGLARPIQRILLLAANTQAGTLDDIVRRYQGNEGDGGLAGCILTKVDEALALGSVLDTVLRHRLTLYYVANGQRVPEDLHRANPLYLVDRAFRNQLDAGVFSLQPDEFPVLMATPTGGAVAPTPATPVKVMRPNRRGEPRG